jgi:sugar lactone lactonase YvrE
MKATSSLRLSAVVSAVALLTLGIATNSGAQVPLHESTASSAQDKEDGRDDRDKLYVGDQGDGTVKVFDAVTGFSKGTLISGVTSPAGLVFADGDLLVVNQNANQDIPGEILRFDDKNGRLLKTIVPALKNGKNNPDAPGAPRGMVLWNSRIIVADIQDDPNNLVQGSVREYSESGRPILPLMKPPNDQIDPASYHPRGVVIGPDGLLYVSNTPTPGGPNGHVLRFDPAKRKFIDKFVENNGGTAKDCTKNLNRPEGLVFGPDGRLYVTTFRASGADPVKQDTDAILVFDGPKGRHPGACVDQIDLDAPGSVNGNRAFAQALLFGPQGHLFVPISGNGPDTGAIRRYDVRGHKLPDFVSVNKSPLGSPQYLTFGKTDPETLEYADD